MELRLVKNEEKYFDFIRQLRNDEENQSGFIDKVNITSEQQKNYMKKYKDNYFVCLQKQNPVGYIGVIEDDIRVCTEKHSKGKGIGFFMLSEIIKIYPEATAKILKDNVISLKLFQKCNFVIYDTDKNFFYLKK
jgi:RimJ/RimL family protein N-acetyltransferase